MSINGVRFLPGLSMPSSSSAMGPRPSAIAPCIDGWPRGFRCPICNGCARSRFKRGTLVYDQYRACRHQTSLITGTLFESSKPPLRIWRLALHLLTSTKTNLAALELMRHLGVNDKTARQVKHKIMQAMSEREASRKLQGFVQIDDAYLGGERNGGKRGRGSENKQASLTAVQTDEHHPHPAFAVIEPVRWSGPARNWDPIDAVALNPEKKAVVAATTKTQKAA